jgi:iron complex outermembrane receptor protein
MKNLFCATFLLIGGSFALSAQTTVTGKIVDSASGQPLPFVVVTVDGTYNYAQSNESGDFIIRNVTGSSYCLTAKMLGYQAFRNCYALPGNSSVSIAMAPAAIIGEEVVVSSTRAGEHSAMAYSTVTKDEIAQQNFGQDLPYLLNMEPSVVTTSDAGTGIGYTGIRIRGSDATRVNVTINGIPVNDAESQGAYWVDLPDVASSTEDVQVQRGVGTSTNGAGAFGGSVNLRTDDLRERAYGELLLSGGSFNTWRTTAKAGTGLLNNHWAFDTRLSMVKSDGYIDRGSSDLRSWYFSGGYYGKKMTVKAITFSGRERTYQAWNGVPEDSLKTNRTYNSAGEYYDAAGNRRYYKDEVDSYQQDYYQLHFILRGNARWTFNWALHATKGKGFYEQYKPGELLADYGLDTGSATGDIVRRLWLDNWFYGVTYGAQYNNQEKFTLTISERIFLRER